MDPGGYEGRLSSPSHWRARRGEPTHPTQPPTHITQRSPRRGAERGRAERGRVEQNEAEFGEAGDDPKNARARARARAREKMSSSLAKALAKYNRPAPESLDPETADDFGDVHARPKSAKKSAASFRANSHDEGHEELASPSVKKPEGRKLRRSDLLTDPKYSGRKVDRATLLAAASEDEEEEEDEEEDEVEDNDDEEDEMSDVSDGDLDANLEKLLAARRSRAVTNMEEEEDDDDDDDDDDDEEEEEEEEDNDVEEASKRMLLRKPRVSRQDPVHVKNQYSLWCELVGLRIRLQGLMQASFRFPLPDAALEKVASETTTNRSKVNEAQELMTACSDKLGGILEKLVQIRETTAPAQAKFLAASGDASEDEAEDSAGQGTPSRKRKRSPSWSEIEAGNVRAQRFAEKTFDVWHQRTTQSQGSTRKALKAVNRTISQQVDEIMSGGNAFISRAQVRPPGVVPIGAAHASENDVDDKADETEAESEGTDMEVYNDSSFYQQLLLAFVSSSNAVSATRVADVDDEEVQDRLRRKLEREQKKNPKKREVDTNASKGRKLRYTVHEKLVNFAAPRPVEEPSVDTVQLFASLFRR